MLDYAPAELLRDTERELTSLDHEGLVIALEGYWRTILISDECEEVRKSAAQAVAVACEALRRARTPISLREYRKTKAWLRRRAAALEAAGHQCQLCPRTDRLQVHHRTYERVGKERADDLIVLCRRCHARHHEVTE